MDQAQFILGQIQSNGYILTNIQILSGTFGLIVSSLIMWGLMTKNINKRIEGKADSNAVDARFNKVDSEIIDIKSNYKTLVDMQQDTNTKVTEIWKFLAEKK